jgi:hydrogenase-4 membrane subunit HyfE
MIVLGVILLIVGFLLGIPILWTIGIVLAVIGAVLAILGGTGRRIYGRAHWY